MHCLPGNSDVLYERKQILIAIVIACGIVLLRRNSLCITSFSHYLTITDAVFPIICLCAYLRYNYVDLASVHIHTQSGPHTDILPEQLKPLYNFMFFYGHICKYYYIQGFIDEI